MLIPMYTLYLYVHTQAIFTIKYSLAALRYLSLSESLSEAIEAKRIHHQLVPNEVCPESELLGSKPLMSPYN